MQSETLAQKLERLKREASIAGAAERRKAASDALKPKLPASLAKAVQSRRKPATDPELARLGETARLKGQLGQDPLNPKKPDYTIAPKGAFEEPTGLSKGQLEHLESLPYTVDDAIDAFRRGVSVVPLKPEVVKLTGREVVELTVAMKQLANRGLDLNKLGLSEMDLDEQALRDRGAMPTFKPTVRDTRPLGARIKSTRDEAVQQVADVFDPNDNLPFHRFVGNLVGGAITFPAGIAEAKEFLSDPQYRDYVNPQGTNVVDDLGAVLNLGLEAGIVNPFALVKYGGRALRAAKDTFGGLIAKNLAREGMAASEAADAGRRVADAIGRASDDDLESLVSQVSEKRGAKEYDFFSDESYTGTKGRSYTPIPVEERPKGWEEFERVVVSLTKPEDVRAVSDFGGARIGFDDTDRAVLLRSHFNPTGTSGLVEAPNAPYTWRVIEDLGLTVDQAATKDYKKLLDSRQAHFEDYGKGKYPIDQPSSYRTPQGGWPEGLPQTLREGQTPYGPPEPLMHGAKVVDAPTPDAARGAVAFANSRLGRGAANLRDAGRLAFGNVFDRLKRLGPSGEKIAADLSDVLDLQGRRAATLINRVDDALRREFGAFSRWTRAGRQMFANIANKAEKGEPLTPKERNVWNAWVTANDELRQAATEHGPWVGHIAGETPNDKLIGERIRVFTYKSDRVGKQTRKASDVHLQGFTPKGLPIVLQDGKLRTLPSGTRYQARQLANPETFFPRKLKPKIEDRLSDPNSSEFQEAVQHLVETGQASTVEDAAKKLTKQFGQDAEHPNSLLRFPRLSIELPEGFYDRDFARVGFSHLGSGSRDVAFSEVWGRDGEYLEALIEKLPNAAAKREAREMVGLALGLRGQGGSKTLQTLAGIEGSYQAATKLTGGTSGAVQLTQFASGFGILGGGAGLKAFGKIAKGFGKAASDSWKAHSARLRYAIDSKDWKTAANLIDEMGAGIWNDIKRPEWLREIKDAGVADQDVLDLLGFQDVPQAIRAVTDVAVTATGLKHTDRAARYWSAVQGEIAVRGAVNRLKRGKKFLRGGGSADRRLLKDWFGFSDDRIQSMIDKGLSNDDRLKAWSGGTKTQVRVRAADLPPWVSSHPLGRMTMRLSTFVYGASRIAGWAVKEASKGNVVPLTRLALGMAIGGEGVLRLKEWAKDKIEQYGENLGASRHPIDALVMTYRLDPDANKYESDWDAMAASAKKGDWEPLFDRLYANTLDTGVLGFYGYPLSAIQLEGEKQKEGTAGKGFGARDYMYSRLSPPFVDTGTNLTKAASGLYVAVLSKMASESKTEQEFLDKVKASKSGIDLGREEGQVFLDEEIVLLQRLYRGYHGGKSPRQAFAQEDKNRARDLSIDDKEQSPVSKPEESETDGAQSEALRKRIEDFYKKRGKELPKVGAQG